MNCVVEKKMVKKNENKARANSPRAIQRRWIQVLRDEIEYLHDLSLAVMLEQGILPPLYGGDYLEGAAEAIPLWGMVSEDQEELGLLMLRTMPDAEPNRDLRAARDDVEMINDWPVAEIFQHILPPDKPIEDGAMLKDLMIAIALIGNQVQPAPGFERTAMLDHMGAELPYAVFLRIPVVEDEEDFTYDWEDMEHYRAEVIFAETPEGLEAAVWKYRLELALTDEKSHLQAEGADLEEEMVAPDVAGLTGVFDIMVMEAMRYYGATSALRAKQEALDILRGEDGDLLIRAPLKTQIEPVPLLAELREEFKGDENGVVLRIEATSEAMTTIWPQVRPHPYFCLRLRRGKFKLSKGGQPRVDGYLPVPVAEWIIAESLPDLYNKTILHCLRQLLVTAGYIRMKVIPPELELQEAGNDADS